VLTVHAAKEREWDTVAVCRVLEESWPDLRRRDTLLGVGPLLELVGQGRLASPAEAVSALLAAERRLFYVALTRARRSLLVTAVDDGEVRPSRLLDDLDVGGSGPTQPCLPDRVLGLATLVAELRTCVCDTAAPPADRAEAARVLAVLARERVPGADPAQWYGLAPVSDDRPLRERGESLTLSPSQVEKFTRCPLRWMLQRGGADAGGALRLEVGTLVHQLAYEAATDRLAADGVWARFEHLWAQVDSGQGWVARRERARVEEMVRRLVLWLGDNDDALLGAEVEVRVQVQDLVVAGRVDRLDRAPDGSVVVIDFKTGASAPTQAEVAEHAQLGVYQWAVERGGAQDVTGEAPAAGGGTLVHLAAPRAGQPAKQQHQRPLATCPDPDWPRHLVEQVRAGAAGERFTAMAGPWCGGCPVRTSCPAHAEGGRVTA
jgi:RecB family exonuclease